MDGVVTVDEDADESDVGVIGENGDAVPTIVPHWVRFG